MGKVTTTELATRMNESMADMLESLAKFKAAFHRYNFYRNKLFERFEQEFEGLERET